MLDSILGSKVIVKCPSCSRKFVVRACDEVKDGKKHIRCAGMGGSASLCTSKFLYHEASGFVI